MKYTLKNTVTFIPTSQYLQEYSQPEKFIEFCKQCHRYSKSWACPPFSYDPIPLINTYPYTYIIGTQVCFTKEFRDQNQTVGKTKKAGSDVMFEVRALIDQELLRLEKEFAGTRSYYAGSCHLCPEESCTRKDNQPCRFPNLIRPSLEAFGFDIGKTTSQLLGLELKWSTDGSLPEYYILVSGLMSLNKLPDSFQLELP